MRLAKRLDKIGYDVVLTARADGQKELSVGDCKPKGKRGRPCKCAQRGIECRHAGGFDAAADTATEVEGSGNTVFQRPSPKKLAVKRSETGLDPGQGLVYCQRCAKWGTPCIHARNQIPATGAPAGNGSGSVDS